MTRLVPKYLGLFQKRTNAQLLAWQGFNALKYGSLILIAISMARWVPDLQLIKNYESIVLASATLSFFFISGLGQTALPFFESEGSDLKPTVYKSLFYILLTCALGSSILLVLYGHSIHPKLSSSYFLFAFAAIFHMPSFSLENYLLAHKKHLHLFGWGVLSYFIQVPFLVVPILLTGNLNDGLMGFTGISIIKFIYASYQLKTFSKNSWQIKQIKRFLKFATPVLLSFIVGGSYVYINAFIVEHYLSDKDFIMYRYGAREFPLFLIIANSFSLVYSAKITAGNKNNDLEPSLALFKTKTKKVFHQLFPIAIALMLSSKFLFKTFYNETFTDAYLVFNTLLLLLFSRVLFPQTILFGIQKTKHFLVASALELITGITLSLLLVQSYGLIGVSVAMVGAYSIEKIYLIAICYTEKINFFKYFPIGIFILYSILMITCFLFTIQ